MLVEVHYYAFLKERFGTSKEEFDIPEGTTIGRFKELWLGRHPGHEVVLDFARLAVGDDYVAEDCLLSGGAVISFLPPVSGGAPSESDHVRLVDTELRWGGAEELVSRDGAGAVATFRGVIRKHSEGKEVVSLSYEAQEGMALTMMTRIRDEALRRDDITDVAIWHRIGELEVGDLAVEIAVSSPHRAASFEVCRSIIEQFKTDIPVFKREQFADGTVQWKHRCH
ncbi:MAG: molybdopterin converting factor [Myxococcales bacterium]|nr:molybdopterin converting factor [Myxococcales bacterium]